MAYHATKYDCDERLLTVSQNCRIDGKGRVHVCAKMSNFVKRRSQRRDASMLSLNFFPSVFADDYHSSLCCLRCEAIMLARGKGMGARLGCLRQLSRCRVATMWRAVAPVNLAACCL